MTDARFPDRWLNDARLRRLTDRAYRTYANTLLWAVSNRTDGIVRREDVGLVPDAYIEDTDDFVKHNLWQVRQDGAWLIKDFAATQTSRSQLEGFELKKRQEADRSKRYRDRKKDNPASRDSSRDDLGQDRLGKARTGQASNPDQLSEEERDELWNKNISGKWPAAVKRPTDGGRKAG